MVSFIVVAKEKKKREEYTKGYADKLAINPFDRTVLEKETAKKTIQSIGIEDVKTILAKLYLKPIKSREKLIVIEDAQLLTPEAQNALLKVLEEPPVNTFIILGTETTEALLPTILSRCQIIVVEEERKELSEAARTEITHFINTLPELSIGERLKVAEKFSKDKEPALEWIANFIFVLREKLLDSYTVKTSAAFADSDTLDTLKKLQSLYTILKTTNVNQRFAIEHTLLEL